MFCNVDEGSIIGNPDLDSVYKLPAHFEDQKFAQKILKKLNLKPKSTSPGLKDWNNFVENKEKSVKKLKIALVGKYFVTGDHKLTDSYVSVIEAIKQAAWTQKLIPDLSWINCDDIENNKISLKGYDGIIVPQGWGTRGAEGKIKTAKYARENKIPYLGLCFGMQMAVIEFARNVVGLKMANSVEVNKDTKFPVIHIMPDQEKYLAKKQYGGTIRLGAWPCKMIPKTKLSSAYEKFGKEKSAPWNNSNGLNIAPVGMTDIIYERHRHRYEFNNEFREQLEKAGLIISGTSPDGALVEAIELNNHPFFVATQFHPEYIARPLSPHPIFMAFIEAVNKK